MGKVKAWLMELEEQDDNNLSEYEKKLVAELKKDREMFGDKEAEIKKARTHNMYTDGNVIEIVMIASTIVLVMAGVLWD